MKQREKDKNIGIMARTGAWGSRGPNTGPLVENI